MKKGKLVLVLSAAIFLLSCTKEARLNNNLDGKWEVKLYSGAALPTGTTMSTTYSKGAKGTGNYTSTVVINGTSDSEFGSYKLDKNTKITHTPAQSGNVPYSFTIEKQTKSKLILVNNNGVKTELSKTE